MTGVRAVCGVLIARDNFKWGERVRWRGRMECMGEYRWRTSARGSQVTSGDSEVKETVLQVGTLAAGGGLDVNEARRSGSIDGLA